MRNNLSAISEDESSHIPERAIINGHLSALWATRWLWSTEEFGLPFLISSTDQRPSCGGLKEHEMPVDSHVSSPPRLLNNILRYAPRREMHRP